MTARASDLRAAEPHARGDEDPAGRASCSRELGAYSLLVAEKRRSPKMNGAPRIALGSA